MRVTVNGEEREIASDRVDALLGELEYEGNHFAIALNFDVLNFPVRPIPTWISSRIISSLLR